MNIVNAIKHCLRTLLPDNLKRCIKRLQCKKLIKSTYRHYSEIEEEIKNRNQKNLRFAAYVVYDSTFGAYDLFDLMLSDLEHYTPKIVVIPDVSRGNDHMVKQYHETKSFFIKKYSSEFVLDGWNERENKFLDHSDEFDVIYLANPYDFMVDKLHGVSYLSTKNVLPIYISYGCMSDNYGCKIVMPLKEISLFWKVFADNKMTYKDYCRYELAKGKNVVLSGYAKMDSLAKFKENSRAKKRIIIAPHHTINNPALPLSNFLEYQSFYLELPKLFPQIEFVFRPHPLLFINMVNEGFWNTTQVNEYIKKIKDNGMIYSVGGDYFDIFVNSDAMIHDCSSFVVEYIFTTKPCCFMAKKNYKKIFSSLGKSCLKNYYLAFNTQQIIEFIQNVVIDEKDKLKQKRELYATKCLAVNYPNVSKRILEEISL